MQWPELKLECGQLQARHHQLHFLQAEPRRLPGVIITIINTTKIITIIIAVKVIIANIMTILSFRAKTVYKVVAVQSCSAS